MKLLPSPDSITASNWEESTSTGIEKSEGAIRLSISLASAFGTVSVHCILFSIRLAITGFFFSLSALLWMSFHMTNLLKENNPSKDSSMTSQRFMLRMQVRIVAKIRFTSTPLSSVGS